MIQNVLRIIGYAVFWSAWLLFYKAHGQAVPCGSPHEPASAIQERELRVIQLKQKFAEQYATAAIQTVQYIPIKAHILRRSDGTGGLSIADLNTALAQINLYYINVGSGLQFYFCGSPNYINNTAYYDYDNTEEFSLCSANDVNNAINVYFPNTIQFGSLAVSGYAYFPSTLASTNRLFVQASNATDTRTFTHELGHYFNLLHTFQSSTDVNLANRELVTRDTNQGANCSTKGDLVCDTPADPYGRDSVSLLGCTYTGTARDPQNQLYSPSLSNIMSYYPIACGNTFTVGQMNRISGGVLLRTDGANQYALTCGSTVTGANVPSNLAGTVGQLGITLTFTDNSANESGFIIERSTTSSSAGFVPIGGLAPNVTTYLDPSTTAFTTYYYRVKASNSSTDYSVVFTITTGLNYCTPTYSTSCTSLAVLIDDFILKQGATTVINNVNSNCSAGNFGDYTSTPYNVTAGSTYTFTARATSGGIGTYFDQHVTIWLDYDQDGVFEVAERVYQSTDVSSTRMNPTASNSFTIPNTASGMVRMRVRSSYNSGTGSAVADPCVNLNYGEAEDYMLNVSGSLPASITTGSVMPSTVCAGQTISVSFTTSNLSSSSYVVQLSDASGNNFVDIPTTGTSSPLVATIPVGTASGTGYKVRVNSLSPSILGSSSSAFTINSIPTAPTATTPINYCQNQTAVALSASGSNLLWYTVATGGTGSSTALTPSTSTVGTTSFWVSQSVNGCESSRTKIDVVVTATPSAPTATTPINYCQNQTAVALSASGSNLLWYTVATGGTGSSTAPTPSTSTAGTTSYWVSQTVNSCESSRTKIDVVVTATPSAPTATTPINYCQNQTAVVLSATGSNLLWYTVATGGTGSSTAPTPSTGTVGTTSFWVSQTLNSCQSSRTKIDVVVTATPSAPTATTPINYCQNQTAVALSATGSNLLWYTVATGGTGSSTAPTPSTSTAGTVSFWVSQTVNSCESTRTKIDVVVTATPSAPTATTPINYCQNQTAVALSASGSNLLWYTVATGGTGSSTAPMPLTSTAGTTSFWVSQSVNGCESSRTKIDVVVSSIPPAPTATTPINYCQNQTAVALSATGSNLLWYTVATGGTGSSTAPTPSTSTAGTTSFWVSQTLGSCGSSSRTKIDVVVTGTPSAPTATTPINYCQNQTAVALSATGSNLLWYTVSTGGTGSSTAPTPSTSTSGTTSFWVSQIANSCESTRTKIDVIVTATPSAPTATTPINYCQNQTAVALSATGSSLLWYTVATGGTGSSTAPTPSTTTVSTTSFWVSQSVNGCESSRTKIDVVVSSTPPAPTATTPVNYCQNQTAVALSATGSSLLWYTVATGGTGSSTAPTPSTSTVGTTSFWVSQTLGSCGSSSRTKIDVIVTATPSAPTATTPINYCQNQTAVALSATGSSLLWYTVATGGTGSSTAPTPSTSTAGIVSFWVSQTVNSCESTRTKIDVTVTATPSAPTVTSPVNYTQGQIASPLTATGVSLKWYTTPTGGTSTSTAPTPSTVSAGTTNYYVSQTVSICESSRAVIVVNVTSTSTSVACPTVKLYLEGAWSGTEMTTTLNQQGLLPGQTPVSPFGVATPAGQPYKTAPWNYLGTETVTTYDSDVVDWVLISLRTDITNASSMVYKTAGLLRKDGNVTLVEACPMLSTSQSFYVLVEHRTHVGAASHTPVGIVNNKITYDFTQQQSYIPSNAPASGQLQLGAIHCFFTGDCNKSSFAEINANDSSSWRIDNGKFARYLLTDYNLDGEINANDDILWRKNNGKFSGVIF